MVFSSVPLYLDPPNWQQHPNDPHQQGGANEDPNPHLPPPAAGATVVMVGGATSAPSLRPNSMTERARLAKIPMPEGPLKCPRCESTNTKFCYFNNYSLSQPRHFCKTCRRYWTRGGALRNVPVGGGCRRNKRRKSNRSKSPANAKAEQRQDPAAGEFGASSGHHLLQPPAPSLSFMASLQNSQHLGMGSMGLKFGVGGIQLQGAAASSSGSGSQSHQQQQLGFAGGCHQAQLPFLAGFGSSSSMYPFQNEGINDQTAAAFGKLGLGVKTEDTSRPAGHLNLTQHLEGITDNMAQFWNGNTGTTGGLWATDLSGISSSSTATHHIL